MQMGLHTLRSNISIIPQTSFIFKGTLRENIDPLGDKSEEEILKALRISQLEEHIVAVNHF